jgi:hypothetical protein
VSRVAQGSLLELPHKCGRGFEVIEVYAIHRPKIVDVGIRTVKGTTPRVLRVTGGSIVEAHILGRSREISAFIQQHILQPRWPQTW